MFFAGELPTLCLKVCQVRPFPSVDKLIQQAKFKNAKLGSGQAYTLKNAFPSIGSKNQNLLKSFASNFNRMVGHCLQEGQTVQSDMLN